MGFTLSWFILCFLNYLQNDLSHKKVQTCSLCLWSLTFINLMSALNGYEGSMRIMKQCLCFWVCSATVCVFYVLVQIPPYVWRTSAGFRPHERQPVCPCLNVMEGLRNGRGTYSGRQGSDPIRLWWTLLREVWGQGSNCSITLSEFRCTFVTRLLLNICTNLIFFKSYKWDFWFSQPGEEIKRNLGITEFLDHVFIVFLLCCLHVPTCMTKSSCPSLIPKELNLKFN